MKQLIVLAILLMLTGSIKISAHCDTMDGPVVADARKALDNNNVNYVLKWVHSDSEKEIKEAFSLTMKVRNLNQDAKTLADKYFFETLVRIHRMGEGVAYTGLKPAGTPIDEKIRMADKAIETGNISPLKAVVPGAMLPELTEKFNKVMSLKNFDVNNVEAGREYVESYVAFFHFAEGEHESHSEHANH